MRAKTHGAPIWPKNLKICAAALIVEKCARPIGYALFADIIRTVP